MKTRLLTATTLLALFAAANAHAAFTTVKPAPGSELNHQQILNNVYGGGFLALEGPTPMFSNGALTFTRVNDSGLGGVLTIVTGDTAPTDDQTWAIGAATGPATVIARAKYAGDKHTFGWYDDTQAEPVYQSLGSTSTHNVPVMVNLSSNFRWALHDTTKSTIWTSRQSDNIASDGKAYDQLTTYRVTGASISQPTFLLFWEDRIAKGADYDYNDAVIELTAVPTPGAAGALALGGLAMLRRRR